MATTVIMPKVDMDQETGTIIEWLKKDGDLVEKGEPILIIETEKVAIDVEAPASGILQGISGKPEDIILIGKTIAYILEPGEQLPDNINSLDHNLPASFQAETNSHIAVSSNVDATPVAQNIAKNYDIDMSKIVGTGSRGKITKQDVQALLTKASGNKIGNGKIYATPAAKRIAREQGIDLINIIGSGPGHRIQAADVLVVQVPNVNIPSTSVMEEKVIALKGIRRTIADRLTLSYQTIPHVNFTIKVDMERFNEIRMQLNSNIGAINQVKVSVTALLVMAVAWALKRHPHLNSSLQGDSIHQFSEINLGVAVALTEGLIVPVIKNVNQMGIGEIAIEISNLTNLARNGGLAPSDVAGGTFTISNLGPFGIEQFTAIINPPQAAILAVGATQLEVVVDKEGQIVTHQIMRMTLSVDHRIVDGAIAAHFLNDLRDVLESPELLLL